MLIKISIAVIVCVLIATALVGVYVYSKFIKKDPIRSRATPVVSQDSTSLNYAKYTEEYDSKSFVEVDDFFSYAFSIAPLQYRAIIECSSISYGLKTREEKEMIEAGFQNVLNNLTFQIVLYVQTRLVDNTKVLKKTEELSKKAVLKHPELEWYAKNYLNCMEELPTMVGYPKCKKKYIIIPYESETDMSALSLDEQEEFGLEELYNRASIICSSLNSIGIGARVLPREEIAKVIYASFNRNGFLLVEDIMKGNLNRLMIDGNNYVEDYTPLFMLETILFQASERIKKELIEVSDNSEEVEMFRSVCAAINIIRGRVDLGVLSVNELLEKIHEMAVDVDLQVELQEAVKEEGK